MHPKSILAASLLSVSATLAQDTGELGDAHVVTDNPVGPVYVATLPESEEWAIRGSVTGTANEDGKGVKFDVEFTGFPEEGGPFSYHIHVAPVPEDGDCAATLAHHDPFIRGEDTPCDPSAPATCQVGDMSGKHGGIEAGATDFSQSYVDLYESTKPGIGAFFGNRSVVVHLADKTRIACANFVLQDGEETPSASVPGVIPPTGSVPVPTSTSTGVPPPPFDGGAARGVASVGALAAAVVGFFW